MVITIAELQEEEFPRLLEEAARTFLEADDFDVEAYERRASEAQQRHDDAYWAAWNLYSGSYDDFQDALQRAIDEAHPGAVYCEGDAAREACEMAGIVDRWGEDEDG